MIVILMLIVILLYRGKRRTKLKIELDF